MTATVQDLGDRYILGNADGTYAIWKQLTYDGAGNLVGPGYIGRATMRADGTKIAEGMIDPTLALNDLRFGGLGVFGWHHHRAVPGETNLWNKSWNMDGHRDAAGATRGGFGVAGSRVTVEPYINQVGEVRGSFEVDFTDPYASAEGKRIMLVRYDYIVDDRGVKQWVTVTQQPDGPDGGPPVFVKEPKVTFAMCPDETKGARFRWLDLFDAASGPLLQHFDIATLTDPAASTEQLGQAARCRARFSPADSSWFWNVVGRASGPNTYDPETGKATAYGARAAWAGAGYGLDEWAARADGRAEFDGSVCNGYCLDGGGLWRRWELVHGGGGPQVELHAHAWEGGAGTIDCLCAARAFQPGESWTGFFSMSRNVGWQL